MPAFTLAGRYQLTVSTADQPVIQTPWFDNLITDTGLDRIAQGEYLTWCAVGSGTTATQPSDTALAAPLVTTDNLLSSVTESGMVRQTFVFPAGTATGTVTEVGIGWNLEGTPLFSRAVLPEALPVAAIQALTVIYELYLIAPLFDDVYELTIGGVPTTCTARGALVGTNEPWTWGLTGEPVAFDLSSQQYPLLYDGVLGDEEHSPSGMTSASGSDIPIAYVPGTHYLDMDSAWQASEGNFATGISATMFATNGYGAYQISFDPPIDKTGTDALTLRYRIGWGRGSSSSSGSFGSSSN